MRSEGVSPNNRSTAAPNIVATQSDADPARQLDVAIIGGGLAGISCALALRESGLDIALFEREPHLGGRAASALDRTTGDTVDVGPHILLSEYRNMLDMLELLGTHADVTWQTDRFITLLDRGKRSAMKVHPLPAPLHLLPSLLATKQLSFADKLSNARVTWLAMRAREEQWLALDGLSARELLDRCGVTRRMQRWFWSTAVLALLNVPLSQCSAAALLRMYAQLIGTSGYRSGFAARSLAELFVPSSTALLARHGIRVEAGAEVTRIVTRGTRIEALHLRDGRRIKAKTCVCALPPRDLASLFDASAIMRDFASHSLARFEPCPYVSTYLWLDRKVTAAKFWCRIWSPANFNSDFYDLSNIRRDVAPDRSLIAANCIHSVDAGRCSDAEIVAKTIAELADFTPIARHAKLLHAVVNRIPMAIACPKTGVEVARPDTLTGIDGLLLAGDWTNTHMPSCMESAVYSGRKAAEYLLNGERSSHSAAIPPPAPTGLVKLTRGTFAVARACSHMQAPFR